MGTTDNPKAQTESHLRPPCNTQNSKGSTPGKKERGKGQREEDRFSKSGVQRPHKTPRILIPPPESRTLKKRVKTFQLILPQLGSRVKMKRESHFLGKKPGLSQNQKAEPNRPSSNSRSNPSVKRLQSSPIKRKIKIQRMKEQKETHHLA